MRIFISIGILLSITLSCKHIDHSQSRVNSIVSRDLDKALWPDPSHIPVCWEPSLPGQMASVNAPSGPLPGEIEEFKAKVRERAQSEFQKAGINLKGWNPCSEGQEGIHILVQGNDSAVVREFGYHVDGLYAGVLIQYPKAASQYALNGALHELGHALGLHHEHLRADAKGKCAQYFNDQGEADVASIGPYDAASLMNYCIYDTFQGTDEDELARLSQGDIAALKELYSGVVAGLSNDLPLTLGVDRFESKVLFVDFYRFKYGPRQVTDCQNESLYSEQKAVSEPLLIEAKQPGELRLCLLGKRNGKWQKIETATEYYTRSVKSEVFADYRPKSSILHGNKLDFLFRKDLSKGNISGLKIKLSTFDSEAFASGSPSSCLDQDGYQDYPFKQSLSIALSEDIIESGVLQICLRAADKKGGWQLVEQANEIFIYPVRVDELSLYLLPIETYDSSFGTMVKKTSENYHKVVVGTKGFEDVDEFSYSLIEGQSCSENRIQFDPKKPISIDTSHMPIGEITLCVFAGSSEETKTSAHPTKVTWHKTANKESK